MAAPAFDPRRYLSRFLAEDIGRGDITGALLPRGEVRARIITRQECIVAGTAHAASIFGMKKCTSRILQADGTGAGAGHAIMTVAGDARNVLMCERTALNLLARMSGIATQTRMLVSMIPEGTALYSTRKTAPGLRYFDKEAVQAGGGRRHRLRLDEMVMIKDNHIAVAAAATAATADAAATTDAAGADRSSMIHLIRKARARHGKIEVEVENVRDAVLAAREGASIIMLDNFSPARITRAVRELERLGLRDGVTLEASGGITRKNIARYGRTGVDMISVGSITSSVAGIDMSLEII